MSKSSVGKASLIVSADGTQLSPALQAMQAEIKGWAGKINGQLGKLGKFGVTDIGKGIAQGLGHAISGGIFGVLGKITEKIFEPFERTDMLGNLADQTGIGVELLSSLQASAKNAGVEFTGVAKGLTSFTDMLSQAGGIGKDAGIAKDKFGLLGVDDLSGSPEEVLGRVADALKAVDNEVDRTSLAMNIFGAKAAKSLLPLLKDGSQGVEAMVAEMTRLGVTLSEADFAKLAAGDDAMDKLSTSVDGLITRMAVELAPVITEITDMLAEALPKAIPFIKDVGNEFRKLAADILDAVSQIIGSLGELKGDYDSVKNIGNKAWELNKQYNPLFAVARPFMSGDAGAGGAPGNDAAARLKEAAAKIRATTDAAPPVDPWDDYIKSLDKVDPATERAARKSLALNQAIDSQTQAVQKQIDTFGMSADEIAIWELRQEGATQGQIQHLMELQATLAEMQPKDPIKMADLKLSSAEAMGSAGASNFALQFQSQAKGAETAAEKTAKNTERTAKGIDKLVDKDAGMELEAA